MRKWLSYINLQLAGQMVEYCQTFIFDFCIMIKSYQTSFQLHYTHQFLLLLIVPLNNIKLYIWTDIDHIACP